MIDLPPPSYQQTIQAIQSCGVARSNVRIKYEDYLQSDEVTVSDIGEVTDDKLRCLRKAVHPFYILRLEKSEQQMAFYDLAQKDDRPAQLQKAREWVEAKGWTARIPVFNEGDGLIPFAAALERACELKSGTVFVVEGSRFLSFQPKFFTKSSFGQSAGAIECVMQMFAASNADDHGIRFGFIGNEAIAEEKK